MQALRFGIALALAPYRIHSKGQQMQTPLNSIYGVAGIAVAHIPGLLWNLSQRHIRMASTSEELLDLFEERYSEQQEPDLQQKPAVTPSPARLFSCRVFSGNRAKGKGQ